MLKTTRRRLGSLALPAIGLVFLVPALAEAQLFPNRTIRREKPDCATEPPFYKQVRRDYFGYYPTCWSRFPAGWGCPCPDLELQSARAEFDKFNPKDGTRKPQNSSSSEGTEARDRPDVFTEPDPKPDAKPESGEMGIPPLPKDGATPFNLDGPAKPPAVNPPGGANPPGNSGASLAPTAPSSLLDMPALPSTSPTSSLEPEVRPGSIALYPKDVTLTSNTPSDRPELGPLPTAPTPEPYTPGTGVGFIAASTPTSTGAESMGTPIPAQAPKRRSLLGQLFGRSNSTTQKR